MVGGMMALASLLPTQPENYRPHFVVGTLEAQTRQALSWTVRSLPSCDAIGRD